MITSFYAGILGLMFVVLSFHVMLGRGKNNVMYGDGDVPELTHRIRIQGNFAEYVPFALLLLMLYETQAGSMYLVHVFGVLLVLGRILHIIGLRNGVLIGRGGGTVLTFAVIVILSAILIMKGITAMQVL